MSYNQEYGGGGSSGSNYYDQNASFDDSRRGGNDEYRDTRYTGPDSYSGGDDFSSASHHAQEHHSSEDKSLFDNALSFLQDRKGSLSHPDNVEVDERHAMHSHQALYGGGGESQSHDSGSVGAGAAVQALKMFTSGGSSDGGMDKNKLIGLAMAQAGKLWDEKQGSGASMVCFPVTLEWKGL